jgi:hypothetical protein
VVKYIANRAAKNINSLDSQTIVPTATKFGRVGLCIPTVVLDMVRIIPEIVTLGAQKSWFEQVILTRKHESGHRGFDRKID